MNYFEQSVARGALMVGVGLAGTFVPSMVSASATRHEACQPGATATAETYPCHESYWNAATDVVGSIEPLPTITGILGMAAVWYVTLPPARKPQEFGQSEA